jgi:uncharacterized delta-60 repeat protein
MPVPRWLRAVSARLAPARGRPRHERPAFRPRVELLEDRLTPSGGLLDPTFGSGGVVNLPSTTDNGATAVAVQTDGKAVIVGYVNRNNGYSSISVQRLNRDGSLDTTFDKTGSVTIQTGNDDIPRAVALQPDGKILVGGNWSSKNSGGGLVARLNTNGTLDTTFGSKGLWLSTAAGTVEKLAVLTDPAHPTTVTGIVAADDANANGVRCIGAVKLTPAGAPDSTFGSGGIAVIASLSGGGDFRTASVAVAPSGEIYLAGHVNGGTTLPNGCVAALTPAGALDTSFGGGAGYVLADPTGSYENEFSDVAVQTLTVNGQTVSRLIVAGYTTQVTTENPYGDDDGFVTAFTLNGTLDTTFGAGGSFFYSNPPGTLSYSVFQSLTLESDGSIVVGGAQSVTGQQMLVGHLTASGAVDITFTSNGTGFAVVSDGKTSEVRSLALDPTDGDILAAGWSYNSSNLRQAEIARLTAP